MMRRNLPLGSTVRPTESSAARNSRYASSGVISCGAMIVTFLLLAGIVPGSRNCLQVIDEIQEIRSPSSVSGFMFSFTIRLLAGNFLHELNSRSPASSGVPSPVTLIVAGGGVAVVGVGIGRPAAPAGGNGCPLRLSRLSGRIGDDCAGSGVGVAAGGSTLTAF